MTTRPVQWEYKTIRLTLRGVLGGKIDQKQLDELLDEAGRDGWELVTVFATALYQGRTADAAMVFKRQHISTG